MGLSTTSEGQINMVIAPRMRAVIADDEPLSREKLRMLLDQEPEVQVVAECTGLEDTLKAVRAHRPDVLLLDIEMEGGTGFDVLRDLPANERPIVIFTTAYDTYALQAFDEHALDYLLKPFDDARFRRTLARAKEQVRRSAGKTDRIVVGSAGRVSFLRVAEIDWIEAADYYACLHVAGKSHLLRRKMTDLERELDPERFCRIHRSTIVNRDRVQELKLNAAGEYDVVLRDGTRLRMSRRYRDRLK